MNEQHAVVAIYHTHTEAAIQEMGERDGGATRSDALVLFGVTGDLAHKMFHAQFSVQPAFAARLIEESQIGLRLPAGTRRAPSRST